MSINKKYIISGVDEAGRGALAGPVVSAAVILKKPIDGLNDSKLLSAAQRERLFQEIKANAWIGIGLATPRKIDEINILQATLWTMAAAARRLSIRPNKVLIDGNRMPDLAEFDCECVVGGDRTVACISAASIVAKVCRDRLMKKWHRIHPGYGFAQHKGYGTDAHFLAIQTYGPSRIHRRSFNLHL